MTWVLALWLVAVIVYDFRKRRIPNWLVLSGMVLAMLALASGLQPAGLDWLDAFGAGALAFAVMLVFYATGLMGAGDVKFAGALGLWVGMQGLLPIWIVSSLLAALHGIAWLALKRWPLWPALFLALSAPGKTASGLAAGAMDSSIEHATPRRERHVPYAAYLAIAAMVWIAWLHSAPSPLSR